VQTCPRCGEENPERARFCLNCGEPLGAGGRQERKFATALFADLVGSTALTEREDPEIVQALIARTFERLSAEIARHGGLVEKFMGDGLLALFGVPRVHEDDAERAVRAGFEMLAVLSELNRTFAEEGRPELAMRIGVEAGEVLVDQDRVSGPRDRMLVGDAVNVASRLQAVADPGQVIVGAAVYAATKEAIEYRELPWLDLKGKAEPVPAWRALRVRAKQRGERPQLGMEARLVGRDEELTVLTESFRRVQGEGRPALVTVIGPAGVGKSRLIRELEGHVESLSEIVYWRRGRCLAYGNASYSALADTIKAQCEILEDDTAETALRKVDAAVYELFGDTAIVPQVAALVGAGEPGSFARDELFEAWRRFLERLAARYPLVLALEDIHWADDGLLDFIEHVADWAQGPILIATLARPELFERRPAWGGGKRNAASIYLDPLSPVESTAMLDDLLSSSLPEDLAGSIVALSEGNPLYVEEIVRKLIDDGVLRATEASRWEVAKPVAEVELPRSVQGLIASRLDGLPEDEKRLLQDAAVVGRVFWTGAVMALTGQDLAATRDALGRLRVKELVVPNDPSSFSDEYEFAFRHALIRDGAYESLPKALRVEKHRQVAAWALARAGDRTEEIAGLMATHLLEALGYADDLGEAGPVRQELAADTYRWSRAAGDRAAALWLMPDAQRWYDRALELAERLEAPALERAELTRSLILAGFGDSRGETLRRCEQALDLFERAGDERGVGWAHSWLVLPFFQSGDEEQAFEHGDAALATLEPLGDTRELAEALRILGQIHWRVGNSEASETCSRRAADIAARVGAPDIRAAAMQDLAVELSQSNRTSEAISTMELAFRLALEANDRNNLQRAYNNHASILQDYANDLPRARAVALEGLELARRTGGVGWIAWIEGTLGDIAFLTGDLEEAEVLNRGSLEKAIESGDEPLEKMRRTVVAAIELLRGRPDEAVASLARALAIMPAMREPQHEIREAWVSATIARYVRGDEADAVAQLRRATDLAGRYMVDQDPQALLDLVRLSLRRGDTAEAEEVRAVLDRGQAPFARACLVAAEGLLATDPAAGAAPLRTAAERLDALGIRVMRAQVLLDLGRTQRAAGEDSTAVFEQARDLLVACDARLFVPEAEEELRRAPAEEG
jgi:class 3 adenylate cyclase/tetratricopeptide (TPR) repeat protein